MKKGWNGLSKVLEIPYKALTQLYKKLALSYRDITYHIDIKHITHKKEKMNIIAFNSPLSPLKPKKKSTGSKFN